MTTTTRHARLSLLALAAAFPACQVDSEATTGDEGWQLGERRSVLAADDPSVTSHDPGAAPLPEGDFRVAVPAGIGRNQLALGARRMLSVGDRVRLVEAAGAGYAAAAGLGALRMAGMSAAGSLYSNASTADLVLMDGVAVHGGVRTAATVQRFGNVSIDGQVVEQASGQADEYRWHVAFPDVVGGERRGTPAGTPPLDLRPGSYAKLTVEAGTAAVVHAGRYFLGALALGAGATLTVDNSDGPVYLWVHDRLALQGQVRLADWSHGLLIGYAGSSPVKVGAPLQGVLVAPSTMVELVATKEPHRGAVFADAIVVDGGAVLEHQPFRWTALPPDSDGTAKVASAEEPTTEVVVRGSRPPYNVCDKVGCQSLPQGGGTDPSEAMAAAAQQKVQNCYASCSNIISSGLGDCHAAYLGGSFYCWQSETKCETQVAIDTGSLILSAGGILKNYSGGSLQYWLGRLAVAYGIPAAGWELLGMAYLGAVQGGIITQCWPQYPACSDGVDAAFNQCVAGVNARFAGCGGGCNP